MYVRSDVQTALYNACVTITSTPGRRGFARDPQRGAQCQAWLDLFDTVLESSNSARRKPERVFSSWCARSSASLPNMPFI